MTLEAKLGDDLQWSQARVWKFGIFSKELILQNISERLLLTKFQASNLNKKRTLSRIFSLDICEIFIRVIQDEHFHRYIAHGHKVGSLVIDGISN